MYETWKFFGLAFGIWAIWCLINVKYIAYWFQETLRAESEGESSQEAAARTVPFFIQTFLTTIWVLLSVFTPQKYILIPFAVGNLPFVFFKKKNPIIYIAGTLCVDIAVTFFVFFEDLAIHLAQQIL